MTTRSGPEALRVAAGELRLSGDLPHIAAHLENMAFRWEADRAALEQARAALQEIANSLEADGGAPLSLAVAKAALLAAASGGAA